MKKEDFYFDLPEELIAQYPLKNRSDSRLLFYRRETKALAHHQFRELADFLLPGDLLVFNDSRVIPARLYGSKPTGGKVELLVERILGNNQMLAHIKASKSLKPGVFIDLDQGLKLQMLEKQGDLFLCQSDRPVLDLLEKLGHIPLPPYIQRQDEVLDQSRYQTVYARVKGSVAAPTAGLHFDEAVLQSLESRGVETAYLTLHVGAGTFRPVRSENITEHQMHSEYYTVSEQTAEAVNKASREGRRVIAVGTTAMRTLESAADENGVLCAGSAETAIFIYPGYRFRVCKGLITNFHLPESTLLMLVSAFIGHQEAMSLYEEAVKERYRFFSYGDASLLL